MGGKPRKSEELPKQVRKIKQLNVRFKALKKQGADAKQLDALADEKELLMEEMFAECEHGDVIRHDGSTSSIGVCSQCGYSPRLGDKQAEKAFVQLPARRLSQEDYKLQVGQVLTRLGINI